MLKVSASCISPLSSRRLVPAVPCRSPEQNHATSAPGITCTVTGLPTNLSWESFSFPVLIPSINSRRVNSGSGLFVFLFHTCRIKFRLFPQCSQPLLFTAAAWGGLKPAPENRLRRVFLHLLQSFRRSLLVSIETLGFRCYGTQKDRFIYLSATSKFWLKHR